MNEWHIVSASIIVTMTFCRRCICVATAAPSIRTRGWTLYQMYNFSIHIYKRMEQLVSLFTLMHMYSIFVVPCYLNCTKNLLTIITQRMFIVHYPTAIDKPLQVHIHIRSFVNALFQLSNGNLFARLNIDYCSKSDQLVSIQSN